MNTSDFKCQSESRAKSEQSHVHVFSVRSFSKALQLWSENINVNFSKIIFNVKAIISRTAQTIFFESLIGKSVPRKFNINFICFLSIYCKHYGTNSFSFQQVSFFFGSLKEKTWSQSATFFPNFYWKHEIFKIRFRLKFTFPFIWRDNFLRTQ